MTRKFPCFLYAAAAIGAATPYTKRLFNAPGEIPPGEWFEDRELSVPYTPPKDAPAVPSTPAEHAAALQARLYAVEREFAEYRAQTENRLAAFEKAAASKGRRSKAEEAEEAA